MASLVLRIRLEHFKRMTYHFIKHSIKHFIKHSINHFYQAFHLTISMHTQEIRERSQTISSSCVPSPDEKPCAILLCKSVCPPLQFRLP